MPTDIEEAQMPLAVAPASGTTRKATAPFDREDADFIIRSRDNVDFYVFRAILMLASTVFEGMFPIPQPPLAESSSGRGDHKPVVSVSEENHVMDTFLRVVYPLTTPQTTSLFHVREVLEAGMKYDASAVVNEMRMALTKPRFLANDPLQVFSIAYDCRFEEETRTAAAHAVAQGHMGHIDAHLPDLASVTAGAYYRLMQLHRNHMHGTLQSNKDERLPLPTFDGIGTFCREAPLPLQSRGGTIPSVLAPFTDPRADVVIQSRDGRRFRVHRAIIDAASPTLLDALLAENSPSPSTRSAGGASGTTSSPSYRMPENSAVVDALLRLCYPGPRPRFTPSSESPEHFLAVLAALQQYALAPAADLVHAHWAAYACREPFRFFFHAISCGLLREAHTCAQLVARRVDGTARDMHALYVPEMEGVCALAYHRLLGYVEAYRVAALHCAHACTWGPKPDSETELESPPQTGLVTQPGVCVGGAPCICARGALVKISSTPLPPALLEMLAARLRREPRGGVLLFDYALVAAFAEAAHNALCVSESTGYIPPSFLRVLFALAIGCWCWSLPVGVAVALGMGRMQVGCGCPKAKHIPWAEMRLLEIARRVDEAVSQVKLDLSGVL